MARRRRKSAKLQAAPIVTQIESLSHEGRGITHIDDKVVFIDGALEGEEVSFQYVATHRNYDEGKVVEVLKASLDRVTPGCEFFGLCGGCSLQHMQADKQIHMKQDVLLDLLTRTGKVKPAQVLAPLTAEFWGYRTKARLGVKYVAKKGKVLVGFREKHSPYLADMDRCEVLDPRVGHKLTDIAACIESMQANTKIAQIEVAVTETEVALVFRHMVPLVKDDEQKLIELARAHDFHIYLQSAGPDSISLLYPDVSELIYELPDFGVKLKFLPADFTQVNTGINQKMIQQAISLLDLKSEDRVLDLFCGLGNFSLPLARLAQSVVGVEGDAGLIDRAHENARLNELDNVSFYVQDLSKDLMDAEWAWQGFNKVLIDPARPGAMEVMETIARMQPEKIVYVSCNPATLARDAGVLVNEFGYVLAAAGVMDMFPHTRHVESMALFSKP